MIFKLPDLVLSRFTRFIRWAFGLILILPVVQNGDEPEHRVELVVVRERNLSTKLNSFGSIEPFRRLEMSAKGQGVIVSLPALEGAWVEEGDVLFELDRRADEIGQKRAEAELAKAELELKKLKAGSRPGEIEEARRRLAASKAVLQAVEDEWLRVQNLAEQGIAAQSELVRARSEFDVSLAQHSQAKARLNLIEEGTRTEEVLIAEAEVAIRRVAVEDIVRRVKDLTVRAPFSGVIARQIREVGEWVSPGRSVLEMMVMDPMKLRISVPQRHIASIMPGQAAEISIPGLGGEDWKGAVRAIIPLASESSRNFPVLLELENPDRRLAAGMYAEVKLTLDDGRNVTVIPRTALQYRDQVMVVYRFRPDNEKGSTGLVEEVPVEIGQELEGEIVVQTPHEPFLKSGDIIVKLGGSKLKDGQRVKVLPSAIKVPQIRREEP